MKRRRKLQAHPCGEDFSFPNHGYRPPVVPEGDQYEAVLLRAEKAPFMGATKLYMWFRLLTPLEWLNDEFCLVCNIPATHKWGLASKFRRIWELVNRGPAERSARLPMKIFWNKVFRVAMRTVTHDHRRRPLMPALQYSVVEDILEVIENHGPLNNAHALRPKRRPQP